MRLTSAILILAAGLISTPSSHSADQTTGEELSATVLMYHRFDDNRYPSTNTSMRDFRDHIELLKTLDRPIVPLTDIVKALDGAGKLPEGAVAITIDDAYASVYDNAWPYLRDNKIPFTLFVATEPVARGQEGYITPKQLREMATHPGVSIANHGHTHSSFAFMSGEEVETEIETAENLLTEWLGGTPPLLFAFPYGEAGTAALEVIDAHGFMAAFGQHSGSVGTYQNRFYLPRFPLSGGYADEGRLREALSTLPLPHANFAPKTAAVAKGKPPGFIEFTLLAPLSPERLNCFSDGNRLEIKANGKHVRIAFPTNAPPPRWRLNCTHPAPNGRWYWLGWQTALEAKSRE